MSRKRGRGIVVGACAVIGIGALAVLLAPGSPTRVAEIYLFVVAALVLSVVVLGVAETMPRREPVPPSSPPRTQRVGQLESVARALDLAEASSFDLHNVLRPIVREIAAARLAHHGISLDRQPDRARALLGEQTWELVRPGREAPFRGSSRGCSREELRQIVGSLEAI